MVASEWKAICLILYAQIEEINYLMYIAIVNMYIMCYTVFRCLWIMLEQILSRTWWLQKPNLLSGPDPPRACFIVSEV